MRAFAFLAVVLIFWLATCSGPKVPNPAPAPIPTQTSPPTASPVPPTATETRQPAGKLPTAPFDAQTYVNEGAGFALDYPAGWTVKEQVVGPRGTQITFVSKPEVAEAPTVPAGETRISATIYQWDPRNDLGAYVQHMKDAWTGSGFTILDEQPMILEQGLPAVEFTVQSPDSQVVYLVAALKDKYLVIAGEGNLDLVRQIEARLRPIS